MVEPSFYRLNNVSKVLEIQAFNESAQQILKPSALLLFFAFFFKSNKFSTFLESFLLIIVGTVYWITSKQPCYFVCRANEIPAYCQTVLLSVLPVQDLLSQSLVSTAQADTSTAPLQKNSH